MPKIINNGTICPTELSWEEKNPNYYLFNLSSYKKLQMAIEKVKNGGVDSEKSPKKQGQKS